ncbi:HAMP domain-containing histidine kinase [Glycomyces sp. TRM65418]|uniref:sensor histidine kinase n=1 Tax=Glycomyces sp. TRM65418 TaxID=2867006 RepID=UPI001CE6D3CE|nr:HAMP domain-containing sensor histidine kinase [Glycomyces sp. TRM65418]MCC3763865.1 HAMP domain-containing histidine kinase [Glycomyces sp. TRM65418]QZD53568.1 HAMP domain-containing histidine kinase [Glycomyces sp. TRM65418]
MRLRTRLTLWYAAVFFAAGAVVITAVYLVVSDRIQNNLITLRLEGAETSVDLSTIPDIPGREAVLQDLLDRQAAYNDAALDQVLLWSVAALVVVGVLAVVSGWLIAGRALRPIDAITSTARRVADRSLHERINLEGPNDELKRLADTFDEMLARLDGAFEGQRRFVGNASHELKTPLAINRTLLEVAAANPAADQRLRTLTENLLAVNDRHERLIDGLLTLARTEHAALDRSPVDLSDIVIHVADRLRSEAERTDVVLRLDTGIAVARGDAILLERLVENLIANGIRHNHEGGDVWVVTSACEGRAVVTVANTGPVVAAYQVDALFEPFRRGEGRDRVDSAQGVGLGLSIVDSIARVHGAEVKALPRRGGGLRVSVEFTP